MSDPVRKPIPRFRIVMAAIFDFITIFAVGGYLIAKATGGLTNDGFKLEGWPALLLFVLIVVYFYVGGKYAGGTLWQRIFRVQ